MKNALPIVEMFAGHQGEGSTQGRYALFIRLARCNLRCTWCDSKHSWSAGLYWATLEQVRAEMDQYDRVVITGGEPLLYRHLLEKVLRTYSGDVEIETNGTLPPLNLPARVCIQYNVSPKLSSSGMSAKRAIKIENLKKFNKLNSIFKFVIGDTADWKETIILMAKCNIPFKKVWLMPQATTKKALREGLEVIQSLAAAYRCNISARLHVLIHGSKKGV